MAVYTTTHRQKLTLDSYVAIDSLDSSVATCDNCVTSYYRTITDLLCVCYHH